MPAPVLRALYQVYINYYYGGRSETELTTAQLTLITGEGSVNKEETGNIIVPCVMLAGEAARWWKSFDGDQHPFHTTLSLFQIRLLGSLPPLPRI